MAGDVAQDPGSADVEPEEEHREDRQTGLRGVDVLEGICGDRARVVGRDLGNRPGGVHVRALRPLELSTGFADA